MPQTHHHFRRWFLIVGLILAVPIAAESRPPAKDFQPVKGPGMPMPRAPLGPPPGMGIDGPLPPFLHGIELTEAQRDQIFLIMHEQVPALRTQAKAQRKAQEALQQMTWSESFDDAKAKSLSESSAKAQGETLLLLARSDSRILALLTPEQRKKVQAQKAQADAGHQPHAMPFGGPPQGHPQGGPQGPQGGPPGFPRFHGEPQRQNQADNPANTAAHWPPQPQRAM